MKTIQQAAAWFLAVALLLSLLPVAALSALAAPAFEAGDELQDASSESLTITFDPNGGTCEVETAQTNKDGCLNELPVAVWEGHVFSGWFTAPEGGDPIDLTFIFTDDTTIYAHWDQEATAENLVITFDPNGGTCEVKTAKTNKTGCLDSLPEATWARHRFLGWFSLPEGGELITTATVFSKPSTVWANWLALFTVIWKNGDTVLETDSEVDAGDQPQYDGPVPTRDYDAEHHYSFCGWSDGTESYAPDGLPDVTEDVTYTAVFMGEDHSLTDTVTTEPTCTAEGLRTDRCACGFTRTEAIPALGHEWGPWAQTTAPTCTQPGVETGVCARCGETRTREIDATGHSAGDPVRENETAPTCTQPGGWDDVVACTVCGAELSRTHTEVPALGHDWNDPVFTWNGYDSAAATRICKRDSAHSQTKAATVTSEVTLAPTPTEPGVRTYTARVEFDGVTYTDTKTQPIPATGYTWGEPVWTWSEDGSAATATFTANEDASVQHAEDALVARTTLTEPDCVTDGAVRCTAKVVFNGLEYTDVRTFGLPALGHTPGKPTREKETAPTCTQPGGWDEVVVCTVCGEELSREHTELPAPGHTPGKPTREKETAPTCTQPGGWDEVTVCTVCGEELSREHTEVPALGHTPGKPTREKETAPTCTQPGGWDEVVVCTVCGEELSREHTDVPALGHTLGKPTREKETAPTCTQPGGWDEVTVCTVCGEELSREHTDVPALGHTPGKPTREKETAPTCTQPGGWDEVTACAVCSTELSHTHTELPALGHDWDGGLVTIAPTATKPGVKTFTCTRCGKTRKETVPATGLVNPFVDVKEKDYFYDAVLWAFYHDPQITKGTDATHFGPGLTCMRQDIVTFLWRANGCPEPTTSNNPFTDVAPSKYYYKAVLWAVENGITEGTSRTTFSPKRGCTRAEVVTFLWRANHKPKPAAARNPFTDVLSSKYYYKAVLWAVENGITAGTSKTKFSPNDTCTRAQIVTFLYRALAGK